MRAIWITDIHLDFLTDEDADRFLTTIAGDAPDVLLVGGDISTATMIERHLKRMADLIDAPICFVLGNHDFYHGSISDVRSEVGRICERSSRLHWLNTAGVYRLTDTTGLVGHDGGGDARLGNADTSPVELSDFFLIDELRGKDRPELVDVLRRLGDEAAEYLRAVLPTALASYQKVIVLTHVPPFREATWYEGKISGDDWLPFFCCKAVGDVLTEYMSEYSDREAVVLCGHTHGEGEARILPNLRVVTGGARYRYPQVQTFMELD